MRALVSSLASGAMIAFGVALGLIIALPGVSFTELIASLGVGGIILGFALRDILENFIAGIITWPAARSSLGTRSAPASTRER